MSYYYVGKTAIEIGVEGWVQVLLGLDELFLILAWFALLLPTIQSSIPQFCGHCRGHRRQKSSQVVLSLAGKYNVDRFSNK